MYYAVSEDDGKTFSAPLELMGDKWIPYGDVKLALDQKDQAWVVFEDRRSEEDQVRLVRVDPERRAASFSITWPGTAPDVTAGENWALVTWTTQGAQDDESGGPVQALVAHPRT